MKPKLANALRGINLQPRSKTISRIEGTNCFKLGEIKMGGFPGQVFAVVVNATNGKVHVEEIIQGYNTKTQAIDQHLVYVTDETQWEMLVDAAYRFKILTRERLAWVLREARRLGIPLDLEAMKWKNQQFGQKTTK